jgi:uncharacterized membrane protein YgaE (UPF0421/DUF939 family)
MFDRIEYFKDGSVLMYNFAFAFFGEQLMVGALTLLGIYESIDIVTRMILLIVGAVIGIILAILRIRSKINLNRKHELENKRQELLFLRELRNSATDEQVKAEIDERINNL